MQTTEVRFGNWDKKTSARLLYTVFGPDNEAYIRECIGTVYVQGVLGGKRKPDTSSMNTVVL